MNAPFRRVAASPALPAYNSYATALVPYPSTGDSWVCDLGDRIGSLQWWRGAGLLIGLLGAASALTLNSKSAAPPSPWPDAMTPQQLSAFAPARIGPLALGAPTGARAPMTSKVKVLAAPLEPATVDAQFAVRGGESVGEALRRAGLSRSDARAATDSLATQLGALSLQPGSTIKLTLGRRMSSDEPRPLDFLAYRAAFDERVEARRLGGQLLARAIPIRVVDTPARVEGAVGSSLFVSARQAGVPSRLVSEYIKLLSFGVDFERDVKASDRFSLVFERKVAETGDVVTGRLIYASINLSRVNKTLELASFAPQGEKPQFFHADGVSVKGMLMKTPLEGDFHESSGFGMRRHPILGYSRMHKGVDFAASAGTPVLASGAGVVASASFNSGHGNNVLIRHNDMYLTRYAHLSAFGKNIRTGTRVAQGQVIGYVGSTGLSTGPHLHYEVWVNNEAVDPNSKKIPLGRWLTGSDLSRFKLALAAMRSIRANQSPADVMADYAMGGDKRS